MRVTYDRETDCAYIYLTERPGPGEAVRQLKVERHKDIILELDKSGCLIGIELLSGSLLHPQLRAQLGGITLDADERRIARHMLGLPNSRKHSYRNFFFTNSGTVDFPILELMVKKGFAQRSDGRGRSVKTGDIIYKLTRAAAAAALDENERLDPEDFK